MTRTDDSEVPDYLGKLRLDGRGIVVLGAGQGIGRQTSHALAQAGARLVLVDVEPDLAKDIAAEVDGTPWAGDATRRDDMARLAADATRALGGRLDGVVDIIGMAHYASLLEADDELWDWEHDICLRHAWLAVQLLGRAVAEGGGGALAFMASVSGLTAAPMHAPYGAFKAGLMALVRSAAVELGPRGVRANAVAPGVVWTPRVAALLGDDGRAANSALAPLRRVAVPADIAATLLFLLSDLSVYVSGQVLVVDGGVSAKFPYATPEPTP